MEGQSSCANAVGPAGISTTCRFSPCLPARSHVCGAGHRAARGLNFLPLRFLTQNTCTGVERYLTRDIKKYNLVHSVSQLLIYLSVRSVSLIRCLETITIHVQQKSHNILCKGKGEAVPLEAWSGPEGSRNLRFPDYVTTAQYGGKVVSPKRRPPLLPGNAPGTHFC